MSTMELMIDEVRHAPPPMLDEVVDFVMLLKMGRLAQQGVSGNGAEDAQIEVLFDEPRTITHLANEQRAFLASMTYPLIDIDMPSER